MPPIIEVKNVSKLFPARRGGRALVGRGGLQDWIKGRQHDAFAALRDISFTIEAGESVGIIGSNGSGKSTLLKLIAGVSTPTTGEINVYGRVASLLELGAGFHPILTGRENIYLNAGMLGVRHKDTRRVIDSIIEFSGIGDHIDQPVDTYSSGMYVRLGFAVAVHTDPAIFLVDEVLAVGDEEYQRRCRQRISELRADGKTILFVSHDLGLVHSLCDRVLLLRHGELTERSSSRETIDFYLRQVGHDQGVHVMRKGGLELVLNNGRLALFRNGVEISTPLGFEFQMLCMQVWQGVAQAEWRLVEKSETHCKAVGRMLRLPVLVHYDLALDDEGVSWRIDIECERDADISVCEANFFLRTHYDRWLYSDLEGAFPEILPSDTDEAALMVSEMDVRQVAAFSESEGIPPICVGVEPGEFFAKLTWANSDFTASSRVLHATARIPDTIQPVRAGRHHFGTFQVALGRSESQILQDVRLERSVRNGLLSARFYQGCVQFSYDGSALSTLLHFWIALHVDHLWHNSRTLRWDKVYRDGEALVAEGQSRRLPIRQYWRLFPEEDGIVIDVEVEALEPVTVQEYHGSIMVPDSYTHWRTALEDGVFPNMQPGDEDWVHLNQNYAPSEWGQLEQAEKPGIRLSTADNVVPLRFTVLNTGFNQHARVLQALRVPDAGLLQWNQGRHACFRGRISAIS